MDMVEDGEFVVPGTELGYSEEFIPGEGAYEEDGKVYASRTGTLVIDMKERKIKVTPKTSVPPIPDNGDVVIGKVIDVKPQTALVNLVKIKGINRSPPGEVLGSIHISQTRNVYVSDLGKEFRVGDIVLAKVTNSKRTPLQLSTVQKELGVIRAFCGRCALPLLKEGNKLKCSNCGRTEVRRLSPSYGSGEV
jgi:exosome complex component CSL4